ncbi:MAG: glycosyltransferase family 2 protein [Marinilabiliaceae bacterium]|nr:glycosyltransferase family 2 protein [Marinilabiliaceae bacterium]
MSKTNYLFSFIKYIQPVWYFNLKAQREYWPDYNSLSEDDKQMIRYDDQYTTEKAALCDAAYQAIHKGIVAGNDNESLIPQKSVNTVIDNYRFIRKYNHPIWSVYVLVIRLLHFQSPVAEIKAFTKCRKIKRNNLIDVFKIYDDYTNYHSQLVESSPLVTVIIPTLNRYDFLHNTLKDFEKQDYKNFEIIVADQSDHFEIEFYKKYDLKLKVHHLAQKGVWNARNFAVKKASGDIIALSEDDVRIQPNWIREHLKCLCYFDADISAGVFYPEGGAIPGEKSFFKPADQFATGNAMLYKRVFLSTGLFDKQFERQRMGDGEFGLRSYLLGYRSINNPIASCVDVKASTGGFREFGVWDAFRSSHIFSPRPVPSVLYLTRKYYGRSASLWYLLLNIPLSVIPYKYKNEKYLRILGLFLFILLLPLIIIQVIQSWIKSGEMIKNGPLIETL